VYVTHDQSEALALSDRIAVMHAGELQQYGTPREVYTRPANRTVADFMGLVNLIPARVRRPGPSGLVALGGGEHLVEVALPGSLEEGAAVQVIVRPENLQVATLAPAATAGPGAVPGKVAELTFLGNLVDCHVTLDDGTRVRVQVDPEQRLEIGQRVAVRIEAATVFE
jgi:ABC-type Fe3+/spermidine/putrescine transport system ATPase subunit